MLLRTVSKTVGWYGDIILLLHPGCQTICYDNILLLYLGCQTIRYDNILLLHLGCQTIAEWLYYASAPAVSTHR
jgi:hypothetical protein